jgi:hypothetical protein
MKKNTYLRISALMLMLALATSAISAQGVLAKYISSNVADDVNFYIIHAYNTESSNDTDRTTAGVYGAHIRYYSNNNIQDRSNASYDEIKLKKGWWAFLLKGGNGGLGYVSSYGGGYGGKGGYVRGCYYFSADTSVYVLAGRGGEYDGAGTSAVWSAGRGYDDGGGGGGLSAITTARNGGTAPTEAQTIAVAGGGGGGSEYSIESGTGRAGYNGGDAGSICPDTAYNIAQGIAANGNRRVQVGQQGQTGKYNSGTTYTGNWSTAQGDHVGDSDYTANSGGGGGDGVGGEGGWGDGPDGTAGGYWDGGNGTGSSGGGGSGFYGGGSGGNNSSLDRDGSGGGGSAFVRAGVYDIPTSGAFSFAHTFFLGNNLYANRHDGFVALVYMGDINGARPWINTTTY